jgi:hypothetical protein
MELYLILMGIAIGIFAGLLFGLAGMNLLEAIKNRDSECGFTGGLWLFFAILMIAIEALIFNL